MINKTSVADARRALYNVMNCSYYNSKNISNYYSRLHEQLWKPGTKGGYGCKGPYRCVDPEFMRLFCVFSPIFAFKTVKMTLSDALPLLVDQSLDLKVIHLMRDPRGVLNSRKNSVQWCTRDCRNIEKHCEMLEKDLILSEELKQKIPHKYISVRYEDLSHDPMKFTWNLVGFLGVPFTASTKAFVRNHTHASKIRQQNEHWNSAYRDSKKTMYSWKTKLSLGEMLMIENMCKVPMKMLNYPLIGEAMNLTLVI